MKLKIVQRYTIIRLFNSYSVLGPGSLVGLITSQAQWPTFHIILLLRQLET